ncbi:Uma2 family endonuclease [Nocardia sp. NPDC048505]|uniref:Uma2 family endonuclease n=1 Tax=unclassified Nocardia TaxID=2637762 RepID=UPI0033D054C8
MSIPHDARPDLPEYMTWEELSELPDQVARQIELWEGRVVWTRTGSAAHTDAAVELRNALKRCAMQHRSDYPEQCWSASTELNVFFQRGSKNDFVTPDFMVYRCLPTGFESVYADQAVIVGEVLSPSNSADDIEAEKRKYAAGRIPMYWEVELSRQPRGIASVTVYCLFDHFAGVFDDVAAMNGPSYIKLFEWTPRTDPAGIHIDLPFPIRISWEELAF